MRVLEMVANPDLVPLGTALPADELLPARALARALRGVTRDAASARGPVTPSGSEALRREIAKRALDAGHTVTPDDIVVTCGCAEALSLCLRALARPGDTVAVEAPAYFGTLQAIEVLGLRAVEIPVDPDTGLRIEALEEALGRTDVAALVVTPNVHNPLGCIMPDERKRELMSVLKLATTAATAVPPQLAIAAYLASGGYEHHLRRLRRSLHATVDRFAFEIAERFPVGTRISHPAGGYLLWVQLPDETTPWHCSDVPCAGA
jgi:DNA-binding transcriptional MocR family regulator